MNDIHAELRNRVDSFAEELAELVRRAALEAVREALAAGSAAPAAAASPKGRGRRAAEPTRAHAANGSSGSSHGSSVSSSAAPRAAKSAPAAAKSAPPTSHSAAAQSGPGQKRDPKLLQKLVERLAAHIASKPGQRIEQINKPLGVPTKDLSLPIKKLLRSGRIVAKGQKRSTTYWPK